MLQSCSVYGTNLGERMASLIRFDVIRIRKVVLVVVVSSLTVRQDNDAAFIRECAYSKVQYGP